MNSIYVLNVFLLSISYILIVKTREEISNFVFNIFKLDE